MDDQTPLLPGTSQLLGAKLTDTERDLLPWEPEKLNPRHLQVINLFATGAFNQNEIAAIVGYTAQRVSIILSHPNAQRLIAQKTSDNLSKVSGNVQQMITAHTMEAMQINIDLMRHAKSETVRQRSAWDILDRGGHQAKRIVVNESTQLNETSAALIRDAAREIKGEVIEYQPVENSQSALDDYSILDSD